MDIRCLILGHAGDWNYLPGSKCIQERTCRRPRCRTTESRERHPEETNPTDYKFAEVGKCLMKAVCLECGLLVDGTDKYVHDWGEFHYIRGGSCVQRETCTRCGCLGRKRICHDWSDWRYERERDCKQVRICNRDGAIERREYHPEMSKPFYESDKSCFLSVACTRCPYVIKTKEGERHVLEAVYEEIEVFNGSIGGSVSSVLTGYRCKHCPYESSE